MSVAVSSALIRFFAHDFGLVTYQVSKFPEPGRCGTRVWTGVPILNMGIELDVVYQDSTE